MKTSTSCTTGKTDMENNCITIGIRKIVDLFPIFQNGLPIHGNVGCSVETFLVELFDISLSGIDERIPIILLDGKPVEYPGSSIIRDGSVLALSSAMPGLAGASLRRGGHLASFRKTITNPGGDRNAAPRLGVVTVKFFNMLIKDLGIPMLEKGVVLSGRHLSAVLKELQSRSPVVISEVMIDGKEMSDTFDFRYLAASADQAWFFRIIADRTGSVLL